MKIIRAGEDDWERVREVRLRALRDSPSAFTSSLEREEGFREQHWRMRLRGSTWFLADDDATPDGADGGRAGAIGVVCGMEEPGAPAGDRHVVALWVAPDDRGRGVGQRLLAAVEDWAREQGAATLSLWLVDGNESAARAYRRRGFRPTGIRMVVPRDPSRTEERWELDLTSGEPT